MFFVYVLDSQTVDKLYVGYSKNLKARLKEHNLGQNTSTKGNNWHCIYYEACLNEKDARRRERYLKTTQGGRMLKRRLKEYLYERRAS